MQVTSTGLCPGKVKVSAPVVRSHTFTVESGILDPEARLALSGLNATQVTAAVWPLSVRSSRPLVKSQTFTRWSSPAVAIRAPSLLSAMQVIAPAWARMVLATPALAVSQKARAPSESPEMTCLPSPVKVAAVIFPVCPLEASNVWIGLPLTVSRGVSSDGLAISRVCGPG